MAKSWEEIRKQIKEADHFEVFSGLIPFIDQAEKDEVLSKWLPYTSHTWLGFSKKAEWPHTPHTPFVCFAGIIDAVPQYEVRKDKHILGFGPVQEALTAVKINLPKEQGNEKMESLDVANPKDG